MGREIVVAMMLAGCGADPVATTATDNAAVRVDRLFTHKESGCTVYRFVDAGSERYFTTCRSVAWSESCGKNCSNEVEIPTEREGCR